MLKNKKIIVIIGTAVLFWLTILPLLIKEHKARRDRNYLQGLYAATFRGLNYFVHPKTNLPYDVSDLRKPSSISNIGLYLACAAIAGQTGLIPKDQAIKQINTALNSLEKIEKWHGFPVTWVNVETLKRAFEPGFSYADHIGNLVCGLLTAAGTFPQEFETRINKFIAPMDFASTYDPDTGWLKGGYDVDKKSFTVKQTWGNWYYNLLLSDTRHFSLLGIALKQIPEKHWSRLNRDRQPGGKLDKEILKDIFPGEKKCPYYNPGMEGGGIFMQYLPGIFLREQNLNTGISAKNLTYCQIELAKKNNLYPFWGLSACESPDGKSYLGWGKLKKRVVTPHASILAIEHYPQEVLANLRALENKGLRPLFVDKKQKYDFGFTDSFDAVSKEVSKHYLTLDQSMIFLSLANFLYENTVRKNFNRHPLGKKMNQLLIHLEKNYELQSIKA